MTTEDAGAVLKAACDAVLADPTLRPSKGVTHCNQAVTKISHALGCHEFCDSAFIADEQYKIMNSGGNWQKVTGPEATLYAIDGELVVAGLPSQRLEEAHGHVAVVAPLGMQASGSLGHDVPTLCNVGRSVGYMPSSEAFPVAFGEADYFLWGGVS